MNRLAVLALSLALAACGSGARELLGTAQFEEKQFNPEHARELYQEIVTKYPDSPEATTARERLRVLDAPKQP
jgi:TolA-binding protein